MKLDLKDTLGGYGWDSAALRQLPSMQDGNMWCALLRMVLKI